MPNKLPVIFCFLLFLLVLVSCRESTQPAITSAEAEQTMNDFFTSLSTADSTLLTQLTTDDFVLYEHDQIWNRDSLLALMPYTTGRIWEIQDFNAETGGHIAHVYYFNLSRNPEGRSWLESALLVDANGGPKIKFMHSTKLYLTEE